MKQCVICKEDAGLFAHKIYNGVVCKKCRAYLPMNIKLNCADTDYLKPFYEKSREKAQVFEATASYGELYIDSVHSMLCFSKGSKQGNPTHFGDVFFMTEIREMGIYCADVRNIGTNSNKIVCNVKARIKTDSINTEYIVAQNESCSFTVKKDNTLEWKEPDKLSMFRNMVNQMIDNVLFGLLKKLEDIRKLKEYTSDLDKNKEWAKGVLYLEERKDYSPEEIHAQYRSIMRIFHPDLHPELDDSYAQKLNEAYRILKPK